MTMKLEEAMEHANLFFFNFREIGGRLILTGEDCDAVDTLISHAEATRWRKLSEEKPVKPGLYEIGAWAGLPLRWYSTQGKFSVGRFSEGFTHWRPIVGPEEES